MLKIDSFNLPKPPGIAIIGLFAIYICVKYSSVLLGIKGVSRLSRLAEWDSVFQQYSTGQTGAYDPSLVQLLIPNYFLVAQMWHQWRLPAWNTHSGFGMPLIADVQSCAFSLLHAPLAIDPSAYVYNCILLMQIVLAFAGTFALARQFKLDLFTSSLAAFLYSQSPYTLYYMELLSGTSSTLLPGLLAAFVYAAGTASKKSVAICSLACATYVLAGHPESSLFGIATGSILYLAWPENRNWQRRIVALAFIAMTSMGLAAPMLLPLSEYLRVGDSYKYAGDVSAFAPWQGLILNLISPCSKAASPYLSWLPLWGLSLLGLAGGANGTNRLSRLLAVGALGLALVCLALISRLGILHDLLQLSWLNYIITIYLIPVYLLMLILASCSGLQAYLQIASVAKQKIGALLIVAFIAITWMIALVCQNQESAIASYNFDATLGTLALDKRALITQSIIQLATVAALLMYSSKYANAWRHKRVIQCLTIAASVIISLSASNSKSLPLQPTFSFPQTETTDFLRKNPGRTVSLVEHVLKPNYNIVYGIDSLRVHNPLMPARFALWSKACGAYLDVFRNQDYKAANLTAALDLSGVKYLVTQFTTLPEPYKCVHTTKEGIRIYENKKALPQNYYASKIKLFEDEKQVLLDLKHNSYKIDDGVAVETAGISSMQVDLLRDLAKSQKKVPDSIIAATKINPNTAQDIQEFRTTFDAPKLLVISNTYYPGWKASIDGKSTELMHANYMFQAVYVPAGTHQIRVSFDPDNLQYGLIAAAASFLIICSCFFARQKH